MNFAVVADSSPLVKRTHWWYDFAARAIHGDPLSPGIPLSSIKLAEETLKAAPNRDACSGWRRYDVSDKGVAALRSELGLGADDSMGVIAIDGNGTGPLNRVGDPKIITQFLLRLGEVLPPGTIGLRKGGDEFVVVFNASAHGTAGMVERVREAMAVVAAEILGDAVTKAAPIALFKHRSQQLEDKLLSYVHDTGLPESPTTLVSTASQVLGVSGASLADGAFAILSSWAANPVAPKARTELVQSGDWLRSFFADNNDNSVEWDDPGVKEALADLFSSLTKYTSLTKFREAIAEIPCLASLANVSVSPEYLLRSAYREHNTQREQALEAFRTASNDGFTSAAFTDLQLQIQAAKEKGESPAVMRELLAEFFYPEEIVQWQTADVQAAVDKALDILLTCASLEEFQDEVQDFASLRPLKEAEINPSFINKTRNALDPCGDMRYLDTFGPGTITAVEATVLSKELSGLSGIVDRLFIDGTLLKAQGETNIRRLGKLTPQPQGPNQKKLELEEAVASPENIPARTERRFVDMVDALLGRAKTTIHGLYRSGQLQIPIGVLVPEIAYKDDLVLSVNSLDIPYFGAINEVLGHSEADAIVLAPIMARIKELLPDCIPVLTKGGRIALAKVCSTEDQDCLSCFDDRCRVLEFFINDTLTTLLKNYPRIVDVGSRRLAIADYVHALEEVPQGTIGLLGPARCQVMGTTFKLNDQKQRQYFSDLIYPDTSIKNNK